MYLRKSVLLFPGSRDGFRVPRGENIQNGAAATQITLSVLHHNHGPNAKGMAPPAV